MSQDFIHIKMFEFIFWSKTKNFYKIADVGKVLLSHPSGLKRQDSLYIYENLYRIFNRNNQHASLLAIIPDYNRIKASSGLICEREIFENYAMAYFNHGNYQLARAFYDKQLRWYKEHDYYHTYQEIGIYNNYGFSYFKEQNLDSAKFYYQLALKSLHKADLDTLNHKKNLIVIYNNIGDVFLKEENYVEAKKYYQMQISNRVGNDCTNGIWQAYYGLAKIAVIEKDKANLDKAFHSLKDLSQRCVYLKKTPAFKNKLLELEINYHKNRKNYKAAINVSQKLHDLTKENTTISKRFDWINGSFSMVSRYKEALIDLDKAKLKLIRKKAIRKQHVMRSTIILGIVLSFILIWVYLQYKNKQQSFKAINEKNEQIVKGIKENELLLRELHHRVKNNFQIISGILELQASATKKVKLQELIMEDQHRVFSLSLLHQNIFGDEFLKEIDAEAYVYTLFEKFKKDFKLDNYRLEVEGINVFKFDLSVINPIALILAEWFLLFAKCKEMFPYTLLFKISGDNSNLKSFVLQMEVENSLDLKYNADFEKHKSEANQLINELYTHLDPRISVTDTSFTNYEIQILKYETE